MKVLSKLLGGLFVLGLLVAGLVNSAKAAEYPSKTITWVVPFGAGGGTDRWARIMSSGAFDIWGVDWRVRNVPGATAIKGWKFVLDRPADGYTILMASTTPVFALALESKPVLNALKDIKICALIGYLRPNLLIHNDAPYSGLDSLVAYAKKNPGKVVVGGGGSPVLGAAILFEQLGAKMNYLVYSGTGKAVADFLGKHINIVTVPDEVAQGLAPKKAKVIATSSNIPHPKGYMKAVGNKVVQPKELGLKQSFEALRWVGVHPDTPDAICKKIAGNMKKLLTFKPVAKLMKKIKAQPVFTPMEQAQKEYNAMVKSVTKAASLLKNKSKSK